MATLQHIYLTAHGSWSSGPWVGEAGQFGLRLPFAPIIGAPDKGAIFTPYGNGDVVIDQGSQAGANGTLTRTWTARIGPTGSEQDANATLQIDLAEDLRTLLGSISAFQSNAWRWTHVKMAPVAANGDTVQSSSVYTFTTPIAGGVATTSPPQLALAMSLRADIIGRRGRGRIYLPGLAQGILATDGTVASSSASTLRTAFKTCIDALQNLPGTPDAIPIVSVMSPGSATAVRPSQIRTGNRFDTIQSRRRQVAETYTTLAL